MKRKRFSTEQIIGILNEAAAGAAAVEVCRRHGISDDVLSLEGEVRRRGGERCQAAAPAGAPPRRQRPFQLLQHHALIRPPREDRLDNLGREQRQPEDPALGLSSGLALPSCTRVKIFLSFPC
jgi:hypothetical protein